LVIASLSTAAHTCSSVDFNCNSFRFRLNVTSKRATIPARSSVMSTLSNFMVSLLAPIFWKSSSCPVSSSRRLVFWTITLIYFFILGSCISISSMASRGPLISVKGVRTSCAISVKKSTLDSYSSFSFSISNSFCRSSSCFSLRRLYHKMVPTTIRIIHTVYTM